MTDMKKNFTEVYENSGEKLSYEKRNCCQPEPFRAAFTAGAWVAVPVFSNHTSRRKMYGKIIAVTKQLFVVQSAVFKEIREAYSWADVLTNPNSFHIVTETEAIQKERDMVSGLHTSGAA